MFVTKMRMKLIQAHSDTEMWIQRADKERQRATQKNIYKISSCAKDNPHVILVFPKRIETECYFPLNNYPSFQFLFFFMIICQYFDIKQIQIFKNVFYVGIQKNYKQRLPLKCYWNKNKVNKL